VITVLVEHVVLFLVLIGKMEFREALLNFQLDLHVTRTGRCT